MPYFYPAWSFGGHMRCVYHISRELANKVNHVTVIATNALGPKTDFKANKQNILLTLCKSYAAET